MDENGKFRLERGNPLNPDDALKHHFESVKNALISYT